MFSANSLFCFRFTFGSDCAFFMAQSDFSSAFMLLWIFGSKNGNESGIFAIYFGFIILMFSAVPHCWQWNLKKWKLALLMMICAWKVALSNFELVYDLDLMSSISHFCNQTAEHHNLQFKAIHSDSESQLKIMGFSVLISKCKGWEAFWNSKLGNMG